MAKTIKYDKENLIEIKKSKFTGYTYFCENVESATQILKNLKVLHKKATHVCYAYVINSNEKASDDGEPQGTAGVPILDVIKKQKLNNVLVVVVRYFGGVKLGAGGLVRAYSETASSTIELSQSAEIVNATDYRLIVNYGEESTINAIKNNPSIIDVKINYSSNIQVEFTAINPVCINGAVVIGNRIIRV